MTQQSDAPQDRPAGPSAPGAAGGGMPIPPPQDAPRSPYGAQTSWQQPGSPVPPATGSQPYGVVPMPASEARMWSVLAQLGGTFLSFLVPLVIYLVFKDRDPFVRRHSATALNFHLTLAIGYADLRSADAGPDRLPARRAAVGPGAASSRSWPPSPPATGRDYQLPAVDPVRALRHQTPSSRRTTVSASSRPAWVSTTRRRRQGGRGRRPARRREARHGRPSLRLAGRPPAARRRSRSPSSTRSSCRCSSVEHLAAGGGRLRRRRAARRTRAGA